MFEQYVQDLKDFKTAYSAGDAGDILVSGGKLVSDCGEIVNLFDGPNVGNADTLTDEEKTEGQAAVAELKAMCCNADGTVKATVKVKVGAGATGKFGDGKFMDMFFKYLPTIFDMFGKFFGK